MKIAVLGSGYVGLVTGTALAEIGHDVTCVDIDPTKVELLSAGQSPIYEPGLGEMLQRNLRDGRLRFTTSVADGVDGREICFIAVATPEGKDGAADLTQVLGAAASIADAMTGPLTLCIKSTVPVGSAARVKAVALERLAARQAGSWLTVTSNPEFLKEGRALNDFLRPDRIVVGADTEAGRGIMRRVYRHFERNGHTYVETTSRSAEMIKYASNAMLAARISLMNELAGICEAVGADIMEVRRGLGADQRIGLQFLYAGVGYGGSCLPKDVRALAQVARDFNQPADILNAVASVNQRQRQRFSRRIQERVRGLTESPRVGLWGLAFKPGTDDVRQAPALGIIEDLLAAGARVQAFDPAAQASTQRALGPRGELHYADNLYDAAQGAHALVLVTEWPEFRNPDWARIRGLMAHPIVFDGRNQFDPGAMADLGFEYHCIGRPPPGDQVSA